MTPSSSPPDSQDVGSGWVMVPREPTEAMWLKGFSCAANHADFYGVWFSGSTSAHVDIYRAMLSAAPPPPKSGEDEGSSRTDLSCPQTDTQTQSPDGAGLLNREFADELRERLIDIATSDHLRGKHTHLAGEIRAMGSIVRIAANCLGRPLAPPEDAALSGRQGHTSDDGQLRDEPAPPPPAEADLKAERDRVKRLEADASRMDWLEQHVVNVRLPLVHGSRDLFWASPDDSFEGESGPSDLRAKIDAALQTQGEG